MPASQNSLRLRYGFESPLLFPYISTVADYHIGDHVDVTPISKSLLA
jgi:hypothetical protein